MFKAKNTTQACVIFIFKNVTGMWLEKEWNEIDTGIIITKWRGEDLLEGIELMKIIEGNSYDNLNNKSKLIKNTSFLLKINYHQNHSIQGSIQWLEKRKTVYFRSLMELILLLKEASSDSNELRSWFKDEGLIEELSKVE